MADEKFCCAENYSVLIPYSDLVKLVDVLIVSVSVLKPFLA